MSLDAVADTVAADGLKPVPVVDVPSSAMSSSVPVDVTVTVAVLAPNPE